MSKSENGIIYEETAFDWFQRLDSDIANFSIGHENFDKMKIFKSGELIEIVGENATGKTQILLTLLAELLLSSNKWNYAVYVIDFNGSFRMERLTQILTHKSHAHLDVNAVHQMLDRINYSCASNAAQLDYRLKELESLLIQSQFIPLIIINKIGSILFEAVSIENMEGNIQKQILSTLKGFLQKFGATIITTNHNVDWRGHTTPSLGKIWINGISRRVILDKDQIGYFALMDIYGEKSERIRYSLSEKGFDIFKHH